jgi:acetyltransferase-like isoleucine patch superfamily enzyme
MRDNFNGSVLRHYLATSAHPAAQAARTAVRFVRNFGVPAPSFVVVPILQGLLAARAMYYFGVRVFVCEPLFKGYCKEYGKNFHTGTFLHWVQGRGDIILGDNVLLDGKISFNFGARHTASPTLKIGNDTRLGHDSMITIAKAVTIGNHCLLSSGIMIFDSPGHPNDPERRKAGQPPAAEDIKPVTIEDNVWVGRNAVIFPGVTIGEGSIVSTGAIVMSDVPPYSIVAGNPARKIGGLPRPDDAAPPPTKIEGLK